MTNRHHRIPHQKGAEEARSQLPSLLEAAEKGQATIITKRGKAVAALVPIETYEAYREVDQQASLLPLRGTGRGLWGEDSTQFIRDIRDEWER